jgi:hypothetical protein
MILYNIMYDIIFYYMILHLGLEVNIGFSKLLEEDDAGGSILFEFSDGD